MRFMILLLIPGLLAAAPMDLTAVRARAHQAYPEMAHAVREVQHRGRRSGFSMVLDHLERRSRGSEFLKETEKQLRQLLLAKLPGLTQSQREDLGAEVLNQLGSEKALLDRAVQAVAEGDRSAAQGAIAELLGKGAVLGARAYLREKLDSTTLLMVLDKTGKYDRSHLLAAVGKETMEQIGKVKALVGSTAILLDTSNPERFRQAGETAALALPGVARVHQTVTTAAWGWRKGYQHLIEDETMQAAFRAWQSGERPTDPGQVQDLLLRLGDGGGPFTSREGAFMIYARERGWPRDDTRRAKMLVKLFQGMQEREEAARERAAELTKLAREVQDLELPIFFEALPGRKRFLFLDNSEQRNQRIEQALANYGRMRQAVLQGFVENRLELSPDRCDEVVATLHREGAWEYRELLRAHVESSQLAALESEYREAGRTAEWNRLWQQSLGRLSRSSRKMEEKAREVLDLEALATDIQLFVDLPEVLRVGEEAEVMVTANGPCRAVTLTRVITSPAGSTQEKIDVPGSNLTFSLTPDRPGPWKLKFWAVDAEGHRSKASGVVVSRKVLPGFRIEFAAPKEVRPGQEVSVRVHLRDGEPFYAANARSLEPPVMKVHTGNEPSFLLETLAPREPGELVIEASATDREGRDAEARLSIPVVQALALEVVEAPQEAGPEEEFEVLLALEPGGTEPPWSLVARGPALAAPVRVNTRSRRPRLSLETRKASGDGHFEVTLSGRPRGSKGPPQTARVRRRMRIFPGFALSWSKTPGEVAPKAEVHFGYRARNMQGSLRSWTILPGSSRRRHLEFQGLKPGESRTGSFSFEAPEKLGDYRVEVQGMDGKGSRSVLTHTLRVRRGNPPEWCVRNRSRVREEMGKSFTLDLGIGPPGGQWAEIEAGDEAILGKWKELGCPSWFPKP